MGFVNGSSLVVLLTLLALPEANAGAFKRLELMELTDQQVKNVSRPKKTLGPQKQLMSKSPLSQCKGDLPVNPPPVLEVILTELLNEIENRFREKAARDSEFEYSFTKPSSRAIEEIIRFIRFIEDRRDRFPVGEVIRLGSEFEGEIVPITLQLIPSAGGNRLVLYPEMSPFVSGRCKNMKIAIDLFDANLIEAEAQFMAVTMPRKENPGASTIMEKEHKIHSEMQGPGVTELPHYNKVENLFTQKLYDDDLFAHLFEKEGFGTLENEVQVGITLTEGVVTIHQKGYAHRDLKPENVFIQKGSRQIFSAKVGDFGTAISQEKKVSGIAGTPLYLAPEVYQGKNHGPEGDNWALGIILHQLFKKDKRATAWDKLKKFEEISKKVGSLTTYDGVNALFGTQCADTNFQKAPLYLKSDITLSEIVCGLLHPNKKKRWTSANALKALQTVFKRDFAQVAH